MKILGNFKKLKVLVTLSLIAASGLCAKVSKDPLVKAINKSAHMDLKGTTVVKTAKKFLGKKYKYGANSKRAVDCSSFVQQVYMKHKKSLPRTSRQQASIGKHVNKKDLRVGDLVFFSTKSSRQIGHVGIYIGNNKFIHASSAKKRVVITSLNKSYYRKHYKGARSI